MNVAGPVSTLRRVANRTRLRLLEGVVPLSWAMVPGELLAGMTLAALGIPEALGYAKIAGMPVVTGLFSMLLPPVVFALFGSSRHLVVGADSATAAIIASSLSGLATQGSPRYVALSIAAALLTGACLLVARVIRLGFIANFLSRTVLVGFLTGVGISVAASQLPDMLGLHVGGSGTPAKVYGLLRVLPQAHAASAWLSLAVLVFVAVCERITRKIPSALIAVISVIVLARYGLFDGRQLELLGPVPGGLPALALPMPSWEDLSDVFRPALSMLVVILAQSSATARSYAAKYDETQDEDLDLIALGLANVSAALSGSFVVNGSPTKTQMVDGAGGRTQLAQLVTAAVVLLVLLFLTGPLASLPMCALSSVVFLIGASLIDVAGMRAILRVRRHEFVLALVTACAVIALGVEQGVILAIFASIMDHLRHSYAPHNGVLQRDATGNYHIVAPTPGARTSPGLLIYRFGSSLYYANVHNLYEEALSLVEHGPPLTRFCLDCVAIGDVDYTAGGVVVRLQKQLARRGVVLCFAQVTEKVRSQFDKYGITPLVGEGAYAETLEQALAAAAA